MVTFGIASSGVTPPRKMLLRMIVPVMSCGRLVDMLMEFAKARSVLLMMRLRLLPGGFIAIASFTWKTTL